MITNHEMVNIFGEENLVYARPESLSNISMPSRTKEFILNTGFPYLVSYFRFSMDFEPISQDIQIGELVAHLKGLFTIGCKSATQLIGRVIQLNDIGLNKSASLSEIGRRIRALRIDDAIYKPEVNLSYRICLNVEKDDEIVHINPETLSVTPLNSSIQQLAACAIAYQRNLTREGDIEAGLRKFERELRGIDANVLKNQENLWRKIIEQIMLDLEGY